MVKEINHKVPCRISKTLYDEIKAAQKNLNSIEFQKCTGKKKKTWTFTKTSQKIGEHLKSLRKQKNSNSNSFDDLI